MSHSHLLGRLVLGCFLGLLIACERLDDPSGPSSATLSEAQMDAEPFYYFRPSRTARDIRIPLALDPTEIVIETSSRDGTLELLAARALTVDSARDIPYVGPNHRRIRFAPGTSRDAVIAAGLALRDDPAVSFVGHAYTTETGARLALINRLVVRFRDGVGRAAVERLVDSLGMRVLRPAVPDSAKPTWWLGYPRQRDPLTVAAEMHQHPLVRWAEPDRLSARQPDHVPTDPFYTNQYYLKNSLTLNGVPVDVNVENAWLETKGSSNITVAIIGTGIDGTHPEISGRRKPGPCSGGWDEVFVEPTFTGSAWQPWGQYCEPGMQCADFETEHETAVAGILAAQHNGTGTVGIAPNVMLVSARIFVPGIGDAPNADVADAIRWAWDFCEADVVNGSWSQQVPSTDIADAIDEGVADGRPGAGGLGTVFVFSGGNYSNRAGGVLYPVAYPAAHPAAVAVGAINRFGAVTDYSPYGGYSSPGCPPGMYCAPPYEPDGKVAPELVAPSGHYLYLGQPCPTAPGDSAPDVYTTDLAGGRGCMPSDYMPDFSGTSATAPQVAAAAALLLSTEPGLNQAQVKSRLLDSADVWGPSVEFGAGKLNLARALGVTVPPITSLTIGGASRVKPNDYCMWWGSATGGTPAYTYNWYRNSLWVASGDWVFLATGTTSFTLRLDVEDSRHQTATTSRPITVSGSAQYCFQ